MRDVRLTNPRAIWVSGNPLRTIGNVLLAWAMLMLLVLAMMFPVYPETGTQWFWLVVMGPLLLIAVWAGIAWISLWLKRASPELQPWVTALITIMLIGLVAWGIHSIP
jgi:hypothetical protein